MKFTKNHSGMTLIEVAIAILLFSVFVVAFMAGQGGNITDSIRFKSELKLKDLAEMKLNETLLAPPEFKPTSGPVVISKKTLTFETFEDYPQYEYSVELFKVTIPDYEKIIGSEESNPDENQSVKKRIFENFKKNMEQLVWQIMVTIRHKETGETFDLTTWYYNQEGKIQFSL